MDKFISLMSSRLQNMEINRVQIIKDPELGNALAASENLEPWDVAINIPEPFLIVVEQDALDRVCSYCLAEKDLSTLKKCAGCKIVRYCSTTCQKADWKLIHQKECAILKRLPGVPPTPVRALIQLLSRHQYGQALDPQWAGLESHTDGFMKGKRFDELLLQAKGAVEFSGSPQGRMEVAINLLCRMATNAFRVTLADDTPIGLCFEPTLALANHSCSSNAVIMFDGRRVSLRALNEIKQGEQIFISYVDPTQPREMRRAELQERYFFLCKCEKCNSDETPYQTFLKTTIRASHKMDLFCSAKELAAHAKSGVTNTTPNILSELQKAAPKAYTLIEQSKTTSTPTNQLTLLNQALTHLNPPLTNHQLFAFPPYPTTIHELYLHHLSTTSFLTALILLLHLTLASDPYNYPQPHHPVRVIRFFTIAKLLKHIASLLTPELLSTSSNLSNQAQAAAQNIDYISAVQAILILVRELAEKSHGSKSRFMKEVETELRDVEDVQKVRGSAGSELRKWMLDDERAVEGRKMAELLFGGLEHLAGFAEEATRL